MAARTCKNCPNPISRQSKLGWCKQCSAKHLNSDPEVCARRDQRRREFFDTPGVRERIGARTAERNRNMPEAQRDKLRVHGRRIAERVLRRPDVKAKALAPEVCERRRLAQIETKMGWCPPELRDEYRYLTTTKLIRAAEARAMIEEKIPGTAAHARRQIASFRLNQHIRAMRDRMESY